MLWMQTASWTRVDAQITDTSQYSYKLDKGVEQYFRVAAVNKIGQGTWSEYSGIFTPDGSILTAPLSYSITATINQMTVALTCLG